MPRGRREVGSEWEIHLSPWVLLDGEYREFEEGQRAEFAIEVSLLTSDLVVELGANRVARPLRGGSYELTADVIAVRNDAWAVDFGVRGYIEGPPPEDVMLGSTVVASATLGVDPFHYFDHLARFETFPELIYTWDVVSIRREIAPVVAGPRGPRPDRSRSVVRSVGRTSSEVAPTEWVDFTMNCRLVDGASRHRTS